MADIYSRLAVRAFLRLFAFSLVVIASIPAPAQRHDLDKALVEAVGRNDTATVIALLKQGANANARDVGGRYAFGFARKRI